MVGRCIPLFPGCFLVFLQTLVFVWGLKQGLIPVKVVANAAGLESSNEEGFGDCILDYIQSDTYYSCEDVGMIQMLMLNDLAHNMIEKCGIVAISTGVRQQPETSTVQHSTLC